MQHPSAGSYTAPVIIDLLTTLRKERFSPRAWWRFFARSWDISWATARMYPTLKRSWLRVTGLMGILAFILLITMAMFEGIGRVFFLAPGFLFCIAWQQCDLFWHLGLNRRISTGQMLPEIGVANTLTLLRGLGASLLLGRLLGGISTPSWLALIVFCIGIGTDILDGWVARTTNTRSKLGQIMDGEADFYLSIALIIILLQNGVLLLWLGTIMLLRFVVPLIAVIYSYFFLAHPVRFGSTKLGKFTGVIQCIYLLMLLLPYSLVPVRQVVEVPLLVLLLVLLIVAPLAQVLANKKYTYENAPMWNRNYVRIRSEAMKPGKDALL